MISHKKKFGVYHWDTFDNETILVHEADTLEKAKKWAEKYYAGRMGSNGADRVDIVNLKGEVIWSCYVR